MSRARALRPPLRAAARRDRALAVPASGWRGTRTRSNHVDLDHGALRSAGSRKAAGGPLHHSVVEALADTPRCVTAAGRSRARPRSPVQARRAVTARRSEHVPQADRPDRTRRAWTSRRPATRPQAPFAVSTLLDWHHAGVEVDREVPLLTTYLGHQDPANTYWYLEATPSCSPWSRSGWMASGNGHERARPDTRGVFSQRVIAQRTRVPALSPRIATPGGCCWASPPNDRQAASSRHRRLDAPLMARSSSTSSAARQPPHPRCAAGGGPLVLQVRIIEAPRTRRTIARADWDPAQALRRRRSAPSTNTDQGIARGAGPARLGSAGADHALLLVAIQAACVGFATLREPRHFGLGAGADAPGHGRRPRRHCAMLLASETVSRCYGEYGAANAKAASTVSCSRRSAEAR